MGFNRMQSKPPMETNRILLFAILVSLFVLNGCSLIKSESDVIGEYELTTTSGKITLEVSSDKNFSETISWPNGKVEMTSGKWFWNKHIINFDQLYIPKAFAPDYIIQADASAEKQPKYTEAGHWAIQPEKHWGTTILPIFPDADLNFKMTKRFNQ